VAPGCQKLALALRAENTLEFKDFIYNLLHVVDKSAQK